MLVEARTIDELRIILDGLGARQKGRTRREDYAGLLAPDEPDDDRGGPARQFAPDGRMLDEPRSEGGNDLVREVAPA